MAKKREQYHYEKFPRHYADEILAMKTREERRAALDKVPEHWKELVQLNVELGFQHRKRMRDLPNRLLTIRAKEQEGAGQRSFWQGGQKKEEPTKKRKVFK